MSTEQPHRHPLRAFAGILLALVLVIGLLVGAIELILQKRLAQMIEHHVAPRIVEQTGCELTVGRARASLRGFIELDALKLDGPMPVATPDPLLTTAHIRLHANLGELRRRIVTIPSIKVQGMELNVIRGPDGEHNIGTILADAQASDPAAPPPGASTTSAPTDSTEPSSVEKPTAAPKPTSPPIGVRVAAFDGDFNLHYRDYHKRKTPLNLTLALTVQAAHLSTVKTDSSPGTIVLQGHLAQNPNLFKTDLIVQLYPLHDPARPSFIADGTVVNIDMAELGPWQDEIGITSPSVTLKIELTCREGTLDPTRSRIIARLRDASLTGKLAAKNPTLRLPPDLSITLPRSGTLEEPICNIPQAILTSILGNTAQNIDYILDETTIDGESLRSKLGGLDEKINKELGRLFK